MATVFHACFSRIQTPNKIDINKKGIDVDASASNAALCPDPYPNL